MKALKFLGNRVEDVDNLRWGTQKQNMEDARKMVN